MNTIQNKMNNIQNKMNNIQNKMIVKFKDPPTYELSIGNQSLNYECPCFGLNYMPLGCWSAK